MVAAVALLRGWGSDIKGAAPATKEAEPDPAVAEPESRGGGGDDEDDEDDEADDGDDDPEPTRLGHLKLPFGPFLALGALEHFFFGDVLIERWFSLAESLGGSSRRP